MIDRLYPRGFAIHLRSGAKSASLPSPEYERSFLPGGISYDLDRASNASQATDGDSWALLIGNPVYVSPGKTMSADEICSEICGLASDLRSVEEILYDLGGRYVLAVRDESTDQVWIYHDAHGNRSVYWHDEAMSVSSHWDYLNREFGGKPSRKLVSRLPTRWRIDSTKNESIHALLPNRKLSLKSGTVSRYFPVRDNPYVDTGAEEKLALVVDLWRRQLSSVIESGREITGSLTAGMDTRILLAFAWPFRQDIQFFTYASSESERDLTPGARAMEQDLTIAVEIAHRFGLQHHILRRPNSSSTGVDSRIAARNSTQKHLTWLLPLYSAKFDFDNTIFYRGNMLETAIGRSTYMVGPDWKNKTTKQILSARNQRHFSGAELEEVEAEIGLVLGDLDDDISFDGYDVRDFAYWELRIGRWLAEISNETDAAFDTFTPFNHRRIIDLLMSMSDQDRRDGTVSITLIDLLAPELLELPINGRPPYYEQVEALGRSIDAKASAVGRTPEFVDLVGVTTVRDAGGISIRPKVGFDAEVRCHGKAQWTVEKDSTVVGMVFEYSTDSRIRRIAVRKNSEIKDFGLNLAGRELKSVNLGHAVRGDRIELEFELERNPGSKEIDQNPYIRIVSFTEL